MYKKEWINEYDSFISELLNPAAFSRCIGVCAGGGGGAAGGAAIGGVDAGAEIAPISEAPGATSGAVLASSSAGAGGTLAEGNSAREAIPGPAGIEG